MSAALAYRPTTTQPRHSDGKFGAVQRGEDLSIAGTLDDVRCGLCPTCQILRDGGETDEDCAAALGRGTCVLSPQHCSCSNCP